MEFFLYANFGSYLPIINIEKLGIIKLVTYIMMRRFSHYYIFVMQAHKIPKI